jgi:hypothetical protein
LPMHITVGSFLRQKSNNIAFTFSQALGYGYPPAHGSAQPALAGIILVKTRMPGSCDCYVGPQLISVHTNIELRNIYRVVASVSG